jgi:ABC-type polysaccharide/polyol phosphate transport system ATPase subunit
MTINTIEIDNLSKKFIISHEKRTTLFEYISSFIKRKYSYEEIWALKDISLKVKKGECLGIIGPNGSGKTTLLKVLAKVIQPTTGKITVGGKIMPLIELGLGFHSELTGKENVYLYGSILGMSRKEIDEKINKIFRFAQIEKYADVKLKNYSSGMEVRLGFATSIFTNPDVLLIDEVLSVGDTSFRRKSLDKMKEFKEQGKTMVFVSHSLPQIKLVCDRAILLNQGRIEKKGKTDTVVDYYEGKVYLEDGKWIKEELKRKRKELSILKEKDKIIQVKEEIFELNEALVRLIRSATEETKNPELKRKLIDELKETL